MDLQLAYGICQSLRKHQEDIEKNLKENKIIDAYETNKHIKDYAEWMFSMVFDEAKKTNTTIHTFSYKGYEKDGSPKI